MASTISFSGVGSGIDFGVVRDAILAQRSIPIQQIQSKANDYSSRINSLKQLNTALASLTTAAEGLKNRELGTGRNVITGDATLVTATATSVASLGSFDLNVSRIATTLSQSSRAYTSSTATVLAGAATEATFELRKGGASEGTLITIDSTNNTLAGLRDAINAADAGVTATIVDISGDGTQQRIVLNSKETGASGRVELIETSATGTATDLSLTSLNPPDGDFAKLDAAFTLNGLNLTRSSNTFSNAVEGVTITIKKAGTTSVNVTQSNDIENKLRAFVNAYNGIQDAIASQYTKDGRGRPTGVLAGDSTLRGIQQELRSAVGAISDDNGGAFSSLSQIGVTSTDDGHLVFDSTVYSEKFKTNSDDIRSLLFGKTENETGLFQSIHSVSNGLSDSVIGSVQTTIQGYQSSVTSLNNTVTKRQESLSRLRDSLIKQFSIADAAIGELNSQQSSLKSIISSLTGNNNDS